MAGPLELLFGSSRRRQPRPGKPHIQLPAGQGVDALRQQPGKNRNHSWRDHLPSSSAVRTWSLTLGGVACLIIAIIPPLEPQYFTAAGLLLGLEAIARV